MSQEDIAFSLCKVREEFKARFGEDVPSERTLRRYADGLPWGPRKQIIKMPTKIMPRRTRWGSGAAMGLSYNQWRQFGQMIQAEYEAAEIESNQLESQTTAG